MQNPLRGAVRFAAAFLFVAAALHGEESVCDLFRDLKAADGRQVVLTGELIISRDIAALGAADCDNQYISQMVVWPTAVHLRPSPRVSTNQMRQFREAAAQADRLRSAGKIVRASASFSGELLVVEVGDFPAELEFDSIGNLKVEALPDPAELPVIPICELFQNLAAWKGKRIAVRGESVQTSEGSWIVGNCKGAFYTNGYRWPVSLDYGWPAYSSPETAALDKVKEPAGRPKGWESLRGRNSVVRTATYVGRLRMRDKYIAECRADGVAMTNGFGHLNFAAAELVVDAVRDVELTPEPPESDDADHEPRCPPQDNDALCARAATLRDAASLGCVDRTKHLLSEQGIDSRDGSESPSLDAAIRFGKEAVVKLLLDAGAPVNPAKFQMWPPLAEAAHTGNTGIVKMLLAAGAKVDVQDRHGSYFANYSYFHTRVMKVLLDAGANPNARNEDGQTALMGASDYGYGPAVKLLIEHGADVNLKDNDGRSALMHAAAGKYVDAIPYLLANGADLSAHDLKGDTALDIARKSKNEVAVELLSAAIKKRKP